MPSSIRNGLKVIGCAVLALLLPPAVGASKPPQCELTLTRVVGLEYPWFARMAFLQGAVELVATISPAGNVVKIRTASGPEPLANPAREALAKWQFAGCVSRSSDCEVSFEFTFELSGTCEVGTHCPTEFQVDFPAKVSVRSKAITGAIK
jgi:hypothetical protein